MRKALAALLAVLQLAFAVFLTLRTAGRRQANENRAELLLQNGAECLLIPLSLDLRMRDDAYQVFFTLIEDGEPENGPVYYPLLPEGREGVYTLGEATPTPMRTELYLEREALLKAVSQPHLIPDEAGKALAGSSAFLPRLLIKNAWYARKKALSGALIVCRVYQGEALFTGFTIRGETYGFES